MIDTARAVPAASQARGYLGPLAEALGRRGLLARVTRIGDGPRYVEVISRTAPDLAESIFAVRADGEWWFWWSWAQRIGPAADAEQAAAQIARVLTAAA